MAAPLAAVIVTYDSADVIADCLRSVARALDAVGGGSIVVVDNASTDATAAAAAEAGVPHTMDARPSNSGYAAGVNAGFAALPEHDVIVLNADVRLDPGFFVRMAEARSAHPDAILVPTLRAPDGTRHASLRRAPSTWRSLVEALAGGRLAGRLGASEIIYERGRYERPGEVDWATGAAFMVPPSYRRRFGLLNERYFLYSEETEYMLTGADAGRRTRYVPEASATHVGGDQASSPELWSLSVTNKVRLRRQRDGRRAAVGAWLAAVTNEVVRLLGRPEGAERHRRALRDLMTMPSWPAVGEPEPADSFICFSAQDWWYHNRAHSDFQLMREVARRGSPVLVVNSIGMRMPSPGNSSQFAARIARKLRSLARYVRRPVPALPTFYVMSPVPFPFYGNRALRSVGTRFVATQVRIVAAALRLGAANVVVTIPTAGPVANSLTRRRLVFNRSDSHSSFPGANAGAIRRFESDLLADADAVLYVSSRLQEEERTQVGDRGHFIDHGVDTDFFDPEAIDRSVAAEYEGIPRPRVGFFGSLDDYLVDFDLLEDLARELPSVSLVLVGGATKSLGRLEKYDNVFVLGFRPYEEVPTHGSMFDVAIMPWNDNDWILHSNPIKLKEYLSLGLPVVSTRFAELDKYTDIVRSVESREQFVEQVRRTLADGGPADQGARRRSVAGASWRSQAEKLVALCRAEVR